MESPSLEWQAERTCYETSILQMKIKIEDLESELNEKN